MNYSLPDPRLRASEEAFNSVGVRLWRIGWCPLGLGVFATRAIRAGEVIFRVTGEVLTLSELQHRWGEHSANAFQIGPERYIYPGEPGIAINHSCSPNAGLRHDVEMIARHDIPSAAEIRFDYSTCMSENLWSLPCACGAAECRGVIGDFHQLPLAVQQRYVAERLVQRFIVEEYEHRQTVRIMPAASHLTGHSV